MPQKLQNKEMQVISGMEQVLPLAFGDGGIQ